MTDAGETVAWEDLSDGEKSNFAHMLNTTFDAGVTVEEAAEYYGDREKAIEDFGEPKEGRQSGPECPECFTSLYKDDIPHIKRTGQCPNCGANLFVGGE